MDWKSKLPQLPHILASASKTKTGSNESIQRNSNMSEAFKDYIESVSQSLENTGIASQKLNETTTNLAIPTIDITRTSASSATHDPHETVEKFELRQEESIASADDDYVPVSSSKTQSRKVSFQAIIQEDSANSSGNSSSGLGFGYMKLKWDRPRSKSLEPGTQTVDAFSASRSADTTSHGSEDENSMMGKTLQAKMMPLSNEGSISTSEMSDASSSGLRVHQRLMGKSMPAGFLSASNTEESEALDQVSELRLNGDSAFTSTIVFSEGESSQTSEESLAGEPSEHRRPDLLSRSFGSAASGTFPRITRSFTGFAKKLGPISAPTTPGLSLLTLVAASNGVNIAPVSSPKPLSISTAVEPELPPKVVKVALSAHEIHPHISDIAKAYSLDDYHVIRRVGKGGFAKVFLVRQRKSSRKYYALKCIKKSEIIRLKQEKQILNEKNILKKFKHPFIVDLFHTFQTRTYLFMTLEFVPGGDLYTLMKSNKCFPEEHAKFYISEVIVALDFLHSINIIYRDLKPEVCQFHWELYIDLERIFYWMQQVTSNWLILDLQEYCMERQSMLP